MDQFTDDMFSKKEPTLEQEEMFRRVKERAKEAAKAYTALAGNPQAMEEMEALGRRVEN